MSYERIVLLHLSDLHFRAGVSGRTYDPDLPVRGALLADLDKLVALTGPVNAVIVTGDIAFQGAAQEYEFALTWLRDVAQASGCKPENTFVVPGNHDVDRGLWRANPMISDVQRAIREAAPRDRLQVLLDRLSNPASCRTLLEPLAAYNEFAARFDCTITSVDRLFWESTMQFTDGPKLVLRGLTSVLLSGPGDTPRSLYLSPLQTNHIALPGSMYLTMCHHPNDWFADMEEVEDAITQRSAIHACGHKHRQRLDMRGRHCRLGAAATLPARDEDRWEPGYNVVCLSVPDPANRYDLLCEIYQRRWQPAPERFVAVQAENGEECFRHSISIAAPRAPARAALAATPSHVAVNSEAPTNPAVEAIMSDTRDRAVLFRFWDLSSGERRAILDRLGVSDPADRLLPEPERVRRALVRIRTLNLSDELARQVTAHERPA